MSLATGVLEARDIVALLQNLIEDSELAPGDRLPPIRELAVKYDVKAGVIRDALLTAQAMGVVKILPRVGAIVQSEHVADSSSTPENSFGEVVAQPDQNLFHIL